MYIDRRQLRATASPVMHGWPPDSEYLRLSDNDSSLHRQRHLFTVGNHQPVPPGAIKSLHNHTLSNHDPTLLCHNMQTNVQIPPHKDAIHNTTMNTLPDDLLDLIASDYVDTNVEPLWPTPPLQEKHHNGTDPCLDDFLPTKTYFPVPTNLTKHAESSNRSHSGIILPATQTLSDRKTVSHLSTPDLTPHTPDGSLSTPESSIDRVVENSTARIDLQPGVPSPPKYKAILPAPPRPTTGYIEPLSTLPWSPSRPFQNFGEYPTATFRPSTLSVPTDPQCQLQQSNPEYLSQGPSWIDAPLEGGNEDDLAFFDEFFDYGDNEKADHSIIPSPYPPLTNSTNYLHEAPPFSEMAMVNFDTADPFMPGCSVDFGLDPQDVSRADVLRAPDLSTTPQLTQPDPLSVRGGEGSRRDTSRDLELLDLRSRGISYREIKKQYGFKEAESTLRGRVRALTKSKDLRVRRPIWTSRDVRSARPALCIHADLATDPINVYHSLGVSAEGKPVHRYQPCSRLDGVEL
jgi:hypothetical protein